MKRAERYSKGQSLVIVAFAIFVLIGFVGLAVDLGLTYMERIRARRAADAAALSAAAELPLEAAAQIRALEFLDENDYGCQLEVDPAAAGYRCGETDTVRLEINRSYVSGPSTENAERVIVINTSDYRDPPTLADSANRIRVEVIQKAPIYFMRVFGFDDMPVSGAAIAENINNLDVALVFDQSGSMEFDTLCFGCWTPGSDPYPDGQFNPLNWDGDQNGIADHCEGSSPVNYQSNDYVIIEAEEYSYVTPSYNRAMYNPGKTYWVIQRNGGRNAGNYGVPSYLRSSDGAGSLGRDELGGYIAHQPPRTALGADGMGVPCDIDDITNYGVCSTHSKVMSWGGPYTAPRVDYDFYPPSTGRWYVWFRGQGGDGKNFIWGLDGTPRGDKNSKHSTNFTNLASHNRWSWQRAGSVNLTAGQKYVINFWGGDPGSALDRIVLTTDNRDPEDFFDNKNDNDRDPRNSYEHLVDNILNGPATSVSDRNRTGWACDPCDARFGGSPSPSDPHRPVCTAAMAHPIDPHRYRDDIYDDEQPLRGSVEAAKRFVARLDPQYDQIAYVPYSSNASIESELQCVRRLGVENCTSSVITSTVLNKLDSTHAGGSTNIADGIEEGIKALSNRPGHYGRPAAAHIMIVMTDGETNRGTSGVDGVCDNEDLWPINTGRGNIDSAKDCAIYYAMEARNNGIVIYTITIGYNADIELMAYIAELTGGIHRHTPSPEQLDPIFDELYKRIFLRLVE